MKIKSLANNENDFDYENPERIIEKWLSDYNATEETKDASKKEDIQKDIQCKTNISSELHVHIVV